MKTKNAAARKIEAMKEDLRELRRLALEASRSGNTGEAARLSAQAMRVNRAILEAEGLASFA